MYHQRLRVRKADDGRFHQRQVVGHVIEEIVEPVANIKQSQSDIPQQQYEGHSLIFQDKHQADRQSKDIEERRDAYQEEIREIGRPVDRHARREVKNQDHRKNHQVEAEEHA